MSSIRNMENAGDISSENVNLDTVKRCRVVCFLRKNRYVQLMLAVLSIYVFVTIVIPIINKIPYLDEFDKNVRKWDINTASFFYTDDISTNEEIRKYTDL